MNTPAEPNPPPKGQFLVYRADDGQLKIDVRLEGETAWLTQAHMAELFQTTIPNVSMHLRNVYAEGELQAAATVKEFLIVRQEGSRQVTRAMEHYNLDAIISVGYRVKSAVATRFRIWATQKLREFIVKGFVLDDERLKNPDQPFDYFEELLRRIQDRQEKAAEGTTGRESVRNAGFPKDCVERWSPRADADAAWDSASKPNGMLRNQVLPSVTVNTCQGSRESGSIASRTAR